MYLSNISSPKESIDKGAVRLRGVFKITRYKNWDKEEDERMLERGRKRDCVEIILAIEEFCTQISPLKERTQFDFKNRDIFDCEKPRIRAIGRVISQFGNVNQEDGRGDDNTICTDWSSFHTSIPVKHSRFFPHLLDRNAMWKPIECTTQTMWKIQTDFMNAMTTGVTGAPPTTTILILPPKLCIETTVNK